MSSRMVLVPPLLSGDAQATLSVARRVRATPPELVVVKPKLILGSRAANATVREPAAHCFISANLRKGRVLQSQAGAFSGRQHFEFVLSGQRLP